jgi:hypothetical protein
MLRRTKLVGDHCLSPKDELDLSWSKATQDLQDGVEYAIRSQATYYSVPVYFCAHGFYEWAFHRSQVLIQCRVGHVLYGFIPETG